MCAVTAAERRYMEADLKTASPLRLLLAVYDIAIDALNRAQAAGRGDRQFEDAGITAQQALLTLLEALDHSKSPELAGRLAALYGYWHRRLVEARLDGDTAAVSEVQNGLLELRAAWRQLHDRGVGEAVRHLQAETGRAVSITG